MPRLNVHITVAEALNGLEGLADRFGVESFKELSEGQTFDADALVAIDECIDAAENEGWVEGEGRIFPEEMEPNARDLADGLRSLIDGDRTMAATLLARSLKDWPDAARQVEDLLLSRTVHDRRQLSLLAA